MKKTKIFTIAFALYMFIAPFLPSLREGQGMGLWGMCCYAQTYQWAKSIGSTNDDRGKSIVVDASGNVYITGYFQGTTDFDPSAGTANLTSVGSYDIFFAKYDTNGNYLWAKNIGSTFSDLGYSITLDTSGNVYISGSFSDTADFDSGAGIANLTSNGFEDIFFAKYDANGNYLWAKNIGSTSNDEGYSIALDASGNVCITGYFRGTADFDPGAGTSNLTSVGNGDIFFAKYDVNGNYLWAKNIGSTFIDLGYSIALDASGNVCITGRFSGTADFDPGAGTSYLTPVGSADIFFAKYDVNGNYLWAKNTGSTNGDYGYSIAVAPSGNVYITGFFSDTADFDPGAGTTNLTSVGYYDIFFAKYDANGNYLWAKSIGSTSDDMGHSLVLDDSGNVYITGFFSDTADFDPGAGTANLTSEGFADIFFAKYDANGNYLWAKNIGSANWDEGHSIAVDVSGNIYITGIFQDMVDFDPGTGTTNLTSVGQWDIFIAKYYDCGLSPMLISMTSGSASCNGSNDGTAIASPIGTPPYAYLWSTTDTTDNISGLVAGTYYVSITDSLSCIATASVIITEPPLIQSSTSAAICDNDSIFLQGTYQNTAGTYYDTLQAVNGCDSIVTSNLIVLTNSNLAQTLTINSRDSVQVGSNTYTTTGTYTDTLVAANGCDSIVTTDLTVIISIKEIISNETVTVFPNPGMGKFTLEIYDLRSTIYDLRIYDIFGREILKSKIRNQFIRATGRDLSYAAHNR